MVRLRAALICAVVLVALAATPAAARASDFHGLAAAAVPPPTAGEFQRMAHGGAGSSRIFFSWGIVESSPGLRTWRYLDELMTNAAIGGIDILPALYGVPPWVASLQGRSRAAPPVYDPTARAAWVAFVRDLIARYGNSGTFWALHPELTPRPIGAVQLWNEVNLRFFWGGRPNAGDYADLIELTDEAIDSVDPTVDLVLAGLIPFKSVGAGSVSGPTYLRRLFKQKSARRHTDVVAVHPYGANPRLVLRALRETRTELNRIGPRRLPLWVTEFGWTTGGGGWERSPLRATLDQQARRVSRSYRLMKRQSKRLKLRRAYYFTFADYPGDVLWNGKMGLLGADRQPKPAWFAYVRRAGGTP